MLRRIIFYSFIFYALNVIQLTTGGIVVPPQTDGNYLRVQLMPFYFISEWISHFNTIGLDWFFWNSVKLTFYNLIMLVPLGIYLSIFGLKTVKSAGIIIFIVSFGIEISQFLLRYLGIVMSRVFNVDDLIVNTLGGLIGFIVFGFMKELLNFSLSKGKRGNIKFN
jgi:glycopeptide antibiotics resistance protein